MIYANSLTIDYPGHRALQAFSIQVPRGAAYAMVGANGSGKSTALLALAGLLPFAAGCVRIAGYEVPSNARQARRHLGFLPQNPGLVEVLSLRENLVLAGEAHGLAAGEILKRVTDLAEVLRIQDALERHPSQLSFGTTKKAGLALALLHAPEVLLLDEPFEGLDPFVVPDVVDLLDRLRRKGAAILLTTHTLGVLQGLVQGVTQLEGGTQLPWTTGTHISQFTMPTCTPKLPLSWLA